MHAELRIRLDDVCPHAYSPTSLVCAAILSVGCLVWREEVLSLFSLGERRHRLAGADRSDPSPALPEGGDADLRSWLASRPTRFRLAASGLVLLLLSFAVGNLAHLDTFFHYPNVALACALFFVHRRAHARRCALLSLCPRLRVLLSLYTTP